MTRCRVLLVEDDQALRRFVAIALDELDIELIVCESVLAAVGILASESVNLILTDLMLPGESGLDLLRRLQESPQLRGSARVVVLSAGLTRSARAQLAGMDVWRLLDKPVSVGELASCVQEALTVPGAPGITTSRSRRAADGGTADAIAQYFEGDVELFQAYRAACLAQFPTDIQEGDAASAAADLQALRRLAHSLKSVLLTLGFPEWSAQARALEDTSLAGVLAPALVQWAALRAHLSRWVQHD